MQKLHYTKIVLCKTCIMQKTTFSQLKIPIKPPQDHTFISRFQHVRM